MSIFADLKSFFQAMAFIYYREVRNPENIQRLQILLSAGKHKFQSDLYFPPWRNQKTILLVHGMSLTAHQDPRYIILANAIAKLGFIVITPHYPSIQNLEMSKRQIDEVAATIRAVQKDKTLCPSGRLGILSNSYSGGLTFLASARADTVSLISSICTIGAFATSQGSLKYMLCNEDADEYGRWAMLLNYLQHVIGYQPAIQKALRLGAEDCFHSRSPTESHLNTYLTKLKKEERQFVLRLQNDLPFRVQLCSQILDRIQKKHKGIGIISIPEVIPKIKAPIALLHGGRDNVIPPSESIVIAQSLSENAIPHRLHISQIISHESISWRISLIYDIFSLIRLFGFFFKKV